MMAVRRHVFGDFVVTFSCCCGYQPATISDQLSHLSHADEATMKQELRYVSPIRAGVVLAVLYGLIACIFVPIALLMAMSGHNSGGAIFLILLPFLYAAGGFIGGVISAALYNLVASWTGGLEFEFKDAQSGADQYLQRR